MQDIRLNTSKCTKTQSPPSFCLWLRCLSSKSSFSVIGGTSRVKSGLILIKRQNIWGSLHWLYFIRQALIVHRPETAISPRLGSRKAWEDTQTQNIWRLYYDTQTCQQHHRRCFPGFSSTPRNVPVTGRPLTQGHDVRGEAVSQQDPSVPLAVQLRYEPVPVDDQTGSKPANGTGQMSFLRNTHTHENEISWNHILEISQLWLLTFLVHWASNIYIFCIPYFYFLLILISDIKRKKYGIKKYIYIRSPQISFFCIPYFFSLDFYFRYLEKKIWNTNNKKILYSKPKVIKKI